MPRLDDQIIALADGGGDTATVDFWHTTNPPKTLVVSAHGYQDPPSGPAALQAAFDSSECDIAYLSDTSDLSEPISRDSLLRSPCPRGGGSFLDLYSDFLLLCCRTSTGRRPIGTSRAPHAFPDGLYQIDTRPRVFAHPFRGMLSREI